MPTTPPIKVPIVGEDRTATALRSATGNINRLGATARSALGMFGVGIGVTAFTRLANEAIQYGSSITDAATATRVGIEEFQVLKYAGQQAGAQISNITTALTAIQKAANDASNGLATYTRAFDALGIEVESFRKLSPDRQFEELGRAMVSAEDEATAYASVLDIIGRRNAPRLMEVLQRLGTDGFDSVTEAAKRAGQVMSDDTARSMDIAADALARFNTRTKVFTAESLGKAALGWDAFAKTIKYMAADGRDMGDAFDAALTEMAQDYVSAQKSAERLVDTQKKLNEEIESTPLVLDQTATAVIRLNALMEKTQFENLSPVDQLQFLRRTIMEINVELLNLKAVGLEGTEKWIDASTRLITTESQLLQLEQSRTTALDALKSQYTDLVKEHESLFKSDAENLADLRSEIDQLSDALKTLDPDSEDFYKTATERMQKMIELKREMNSLDQQAETTREQQKLDMLSSLGISGSASTGGINAAPTDQRSNSHLMGDYSDTAFASPWAAVGTLADPQAATTLATDSAAQSISSGADSASALLTEVADYMQQLVTGLETLKSQVANAL
jgi:hypothetical protein